MAGILSASSARLIREGRMNRRNLLLLIATFLAGACLPVAAKPKGKGGRYPGRGRGLRRRPRNYQHTVTTSGSILRIGEKNPRLKDTIGGNEWMIPNLHQQAFDRPRPTTAIMSDQITQMLFDRWKSSTSNGLPNVR